MDIKEIIARIESEYEAKFAWDEHLERYVAKVPNKSKATFSLHLSHYNTGYERQGQEFIGVDYDDWAEWSGYGFPCDSYEKVLERIEKHFEPRAQMSLFDFI